jgi:rhodanese-related sulfurtransferase
MLRKLGAFLLILSLVLTFGCKKDNPVEPKKNVEFETVATVGDVYFTNYVTTSGAGVNLGIADLFTNLQDGNTANDPVILDYRSAADFATGHIRGAENITLAGLADRVATLSKTKKIVNVCYTGQNSSFATAFLNLMGFDSQSLSFGMCGVSTTTGIAGTDKWTTQIAADEFASQLTATVSTATQTYTFPELSTGKTTAEDIMKER